MIFGYKLKENWRGVWCIYKDVGTKWVKCTTLEDFQGALAAAYNNQIAFVKQKQ